MPSRKQKVGIPRHISDDNIRIAKSDNKIKLFAKFNHKWYSTALEDAFRITNQHTVSADSILTFTRPNEGKLVPTISATMDGLLKLTSRDKKTGVCLKHTTNYLNIRNLADTANAELHASTGTFSTLKADSFRGSSASDTINFGVDNATATTLLSGGDCDLVLKTGNSTTGTITITDGANGPIDITPNGSGPVVLPLVDIGGGAIDGTAIGTTSAATVAATTLRSSSTLTHTNLSLGDSYTAPYDTRYLMMTEGGIVGYRTAGDIKSDGATASFTGTFSEITIDKNLDSTSAATTQALYIDVDREGDVSSSTDTTTGINLDVNVTGASGGTINTYGMDIDVVGDGGGTSTAIGIDLDVDSADTNIGMLINTAGTHMKLVANADTDDYGTIAVADTGVMTIATTGDGTTDSDLILDADGDINMDAAGGDIAMTSADVKIDATKKLYLDGGTHSYIYESADDVVRIVVGNEILVELSDYGDNGRSFFAGGAVGFNVVGITYGTSGVIGGGGNDTDIDFRFGNKSKVLLTGAATMINLNLLFPDKSCNCLLILKQDGSGTGVVTNYKAFKNDEDAADGSATVLFAGGTNPTLTTTAGKADILSIYWDNDSFTAYGTITQNF